MNAQLRMRQYQQQAVLSCSPDQLVLKLYDLGIASCDKEDRSKLRRVLAELMGSLNFDQGGAIANRLQAVYEYCMAASVEGDLKTVRDLLVGLREAWADGVLKKVAA